MENGRKNKRGPKEIHCYENMSMTSNFQEICMWRFLLLEVVIDISLHVDFLFHWLFLVVRHLFLVVCGLTTKRKTNDENVWNIQENKINIWTSKCLSYLNLRSSEIHLFYNLGDFYWHFLEILWSFIFLIFYNLFIFLRISEIHFSLEDTKKRDLIVKNCNHKSLGIYYLLSDLYI